MCGKTDHEILEFVDTNDRVLGTAIRREIHESGLMHRAVHVFLYNGRGEIYVQRRSSIKDRFPDRLDSSAAGHVEPGEPYEAAAVRELEEELGIVTEVEEILRTGPSEVTDNEHVVLYRARSGQAPVPDPDEVQWGSFMTPESLTVLMDSQPDDFVPSFIHLWHLVQQTK
ncbi:MAG: NUDIX domain-containing protein [Thermodesulfobacteriota bacterium]